MSEETWKNILESDGLYQVSNKGNVRRTKTGRILKGRLDRYGYLRVILYRGRNDYKNRLIHRLVAAAFIPNPNNKPQVDHINTIRTDNRLENLRWVTYHENNMNPLTLEKYKTCYRPVITEEARKKMSLAKKGKQVYTPTTLSRLHQSIARKKWWERKKSINLN